jgi:class 3 adenylate cyclase/tetratricopeptide (TPR) repeat protein
VPGWPCSSCGGGNPDGTRFCGHCGAPSSDGRLPGLEEERRQVTALFADLSGFSHLATALDPERLAEVIDPILAELAEVVLRYGGHVEKFAGDALLALFGAPVSHEDDAGRAQLAALDMHAAARRWSATPGLPPSGLPLHIGVNTGQVVARTIGSSVRLDYGVLGDAVVLAQRLQASAPAGETYVGAATYELTARNFEYAALPPVRVRGRADPVTAWRLTGARQESGHHAGIAGWGARRPMVGRHAELAAGAALLDRGGVLIVSGEAGVGKSRLMQALHEQAQDRGIRWLSSRCPAHGATQPYSAYRDLVLQLPSSPGSVLAVISGDAVHGATVTRDTVTGATVTGDTVTGANVTGDTARMSPSDPELLRVALHDAVLAALRHEMRAGPAVLLLEDMHWADPSSVALTASVAKLAAQTPLLLLLTTRESAPPAELTVGIPPAALHRLRLHPLAREDIETLVTTELGARPSDELLTLLVERTAGNPLFAFEIVREMRERGELDIRPGPQPAVRLRADVRAEDVPSSVQGILAARLDLLSASAATVVKVCAVIGRHVPHDVLRHLLADQPRDPESFPSAATRVDWSAALLELQARGLLLVDDQPDATATGGTSMTFTHALVQEVAYSRLLQRQRRELHARVAEALEALRPDTDETVDMLARHLTLAGAGRKAVAALERAAERARRLSANDEAHRLLRRADEVADELADDAKLTAFERAQLRLARAGLADLLGDYDEAERLYRDVRDRTGNLAAWRGEAAVLRKRGRADEVLALLDEADRVLRPDVHVRGLLGLERGRALVAAGRFGEATRVLQTALPLLPPGSDDAAHALVQLARAQLGPGDIAAARHSAEAAHELFEQLDDVRGQAIALRVLGNIYQELGRIDDAAASLTAGLEAAGRLGDVEERGACLVNLGLLELSRDRLDDAARWNRAAIAECERVGHRRGAAIAHANLADTLSRAGDLSDALQHCALAGEAAASVGDHLTSADVQATRAAILLAQGRPLEAAREADEAAERFRAVSDLTAAAEALELAGRCWEAAGDRTQADAVRTHAAALAEQGSPGASP